MANANLALLTTSNTFMDWMITTNNEANSINELRNGNYYKDGGNFTVANGAIITLPTSGTGLQVGANSILGQLTTMNTSLTTGAASFSDNVTLTGTGSKLNVANTLQVGQNVGIGSAPVANIRLTVVRPSGNNANGEAKVGDGTHYTQFNSNSSAGNFNPLVSLNDHSIIFTDGLEDTGNLVIAPWSNTSSGLRIQGNLSVNVPVTLNTNGLVATTANLFTQNFDPAGSFSQVSGNLVVNNITIKGNQTLTGTSVISANAIQLRSGAAGDGDGLFEVFRGSTIGANGTIKFNHSANVFQFASNDAQTYSTLLAVANVTDGFTDNNIANTISANAAQTVFNIASAAYTKANAAANTVRISANGGSTIFANGLNVVNTANVTVTVTYDGTGNANLAIFSSAGQPPGGANQQLQFNDNTLFGGSANVIYNKANGQLVVNNETVVANLTFATGANAVQPTLVATREAVTNAGVINSVNTYSINLAQTNNWDLTTGNTQYGNINLTFINWANSGNLQTCTLIVRQYGPNGNTSQSSANGVTFTNANVIWSNGEVPVLAAFAGKMDILTFITTDGGAHVYGAHSMANVG